MKNSFLIALIGLFFSSSLLAETSWTGFYVGGNLGYAKGDSTSDVTLGGNWTVQTQALQDYTTSNSEKNLNPSGVSFGLQAGYDYQFNNKFVLGIEADYSELNLDDSRQSPNIVAPIGFPTSFAFSNKVEVNHTFSLRPKLGYVFDSTLVYVTAGYAWTSADFSSDMVGTNGYSKVGKTSKTLGSTIFGVGVEHKFFDNISAKLEYLKVNEDDTNYTTVYRNGNFPGFSETFNVDLDYSVIRAGINYRF